MDAIGFSLSRSDGEALARARTAAGSSTARVAIMCTVPCAMATRDLSAGAHSKHEQRHACLPSSLLADGLSGGLTGPAGGRTGQGEPCQGARTVVHAMPVRTVHPHTRLKRSTIPGTSGAFGRKISTRAPAAACRMPSSRRRPASRRTAVTHTDGQTGLMSGERAHWPPLTRA